MILKDVSSAELEIMKIIWTAGKPVIITDIWREIEGHDWTYQTVQTFVNRLNAKGYIKIVGKQVRSYLYLPTVTRAEYIVQSRGDLLDGGEGASLSDVVSIMYKNGICSKEELDKLSATVAQLLK
ncbi:MAG: BlaI/MecI/CopY family transcriptional regulator [Clostridia bacterium]|nr:BlaI/MecI/CopY family transcriptional regulator [Clostridia bacterium]